ncbi:M56 family metallopeptidase [Ruminococcus gauvreauii]|uniref:M56 family metallopeptidase n=1 Tax=Ruminococcus gauvreauii TaxID=438033 RepID=A0ABY5VL17_9FIRM|nr:M56 family metallopeptidase [Ruminococcus gauvreauii]UWP60896.1 M56 family metallopeptidase [Ruminococcus gauvreauii]
MLHFRMDMPLYLMAFYGSIMILAVLLIRVLFKKRLPQFVFPVLWGLVLVRLLIPFSLSSPISAPVLELQMPYTESEAIAVEDSVGTRTDVSNATEYSVAEGTGPFSFSLRQLLVVLFWAGMAATAGVLIYQKRSCSQKLKNSLLVEHNETINAILRGMEMGDVLVFTNDGIASPLVCGILNQRIYLPTGMDFGNTVMLRHILTHETMHIRRRDNWVKTVMLAAVCVNWYNPLVWVMAKYLSADLEAACDAAVLGTMDAEERQGYAYSLLAMAVTGNRTALLYSAFSKTEVERRIKSILRYKKATVFTLAAAVCLLLCTTAVFATVGQAPFSSYLSSYCASSDCRWGVEAQISRDIVLGENARKRADRVILDVLKTDSSNDPDIIASRVREKLSGEFGVEKAAFKLTVNLFLNDKELEEEYKGHGITKDSSGMYLYNGETVRVYTDEMIGSVQTRDEGTVDIDVIRDRMGQITSVAALHRGDSEFDRRTKEREQASDYWDGNTAEEGGTAVVQETVADTEFTD